MEFEGIEEERHAAESTATRSTSESWSGNGCSCGRSESAKLQRPPNLAVSPGVYLLVKTGATARASKGAMLGPLWREAAGRPKVMVRILQVQERALHGMCRSALARRAATAEKTPALT